jgi:hypothetical protein
MSKILTEGARLALALNRDAFGNFVSNQDERAIRYLALQTELLQALVACAEDRNDPRRVRALDSLMKQIAGDTHEAYEDFPKFEPSRMDDAARREQYADLVDKVLIKTPHAALPDSVREQLDKARGDGQSTVQMQVPTGDVSELLQSRRH